MLKRFLPKSLFARTLIIIVTPVVLLQLIAAAVFYDRHLQTVTRRLAEAVGGEIALIRQGFEKIPEAAARERYFELVWRTMRLKVTHDPTGALPPSDTESRFSPLESVRFAAIENRLTHLFSMRRQASDKSYMVYVAVEPGLLRIRVPVKRLTSTTAHILMWWVIGTSLLLVTIAVLFLRNQVKPIRRLAEAAERFGKGQEVVGFKSSGALEVRQAATAFLRMRARIERQIRQRTEMLAGVSHDLRTPLTRLKLQLAMMGEGPEIEEMQQDVEAMNGMIEAYLAFARGAQGEAPVETDLARLLAGVVAEARHSKGDIELQTSGDMVAELRPQALKRSVTNLIDNACRYAQHTQVTATRPLTPTGQRIAKTAPSILAGRCARRGYGSMSCWPRG